MGAGTIVLQEGVFRSEMGLANNRPIDMEPALKLLEPGANPNFEKITRAIADKVAKTNTKFQWRRRDLMPTFVKATAAAAAGGTTLTVDHFEYVHRDCGLFNTRTKELYMMHDHTAVAAAAAITIAAYPGAGGTVDTIAVGDVILVLPEFHAEGDNVPEVFRTIETEDYNYIMQTDRRGAQVTDILENTREYDPRGQRALDNKLAMIEFLRGVNLLFYVSVATREATTAASLARRHAMGGLRQYIVTNRLNFAGASIGLSPQIFGEILRCTKYQGAASERKVCMAGQYAISSVSGWPVGSVLVSPQTKSWGYDIKEVITPHGNIDLAYDPMLTAENGLADVMVMFDPAYVRQVYLQNMGMKVIMKVADLCTTHVIVDAITGTYGLQMDFEELAAWAEGIH